MFCRFCGATIPEDSRFCPKCGKGIEAEVASQPAIAAGGALARQSQTELPHAAPPQLNAPIVSERPSPTRRRRSRFWYVVGVVLAIPVIFVLVVWFVGGALLESDAKTSAIPNAPRALATATLIPAGFVQSAILACQTAVYHQATDMSTVRFLDGTRNVQQAPTGFDVYERFSARDASGQDVAIDYLCLVSSPPSSPSFIVTSLTFREKSTALKPSAP